MGDARDVVVFATDDRRLEFLANVIHNLVAVGVSSIVTVGRHRASCDHAVDKHPDVVTCCVYTSHLDNHPGVRAWGVANHNIFVLWLQRYQVVHDILKRGFSVLISDSDMWFSSDPFPVLRGDVLGKHTVVANTEGSLFPSMNGGLQYFRGDLPGDGSNHLLTLFNDHVHRLVTDEPARCVDGRTFTAPLMDQDILRDAAESAAAGAPIWFSLTHDPCRFNSWEERETARLEVKARHPELEWNDTGVELKRPFPSHPMIEKYAAELNAWPERYVRLKVPGRETWTNITLIQAPKWMFANHGDTGGWMALEPRPGVVLHCMSATQGIKARMLRAYGMWHWDELGIGGGHRAGEGRYLSVANADLRFKTRGEFTRQVARLAALAAATDRKPVIPMLPCDSEWLRQFRCGDGCYAGVLERINVLAGRCPVTAQRQYQPWWSQTSGGSGGSSSGSRESEGGLVVKGGEVGTPCCYYVPPGDFCNEEFAAWGMEMTPPDRSGGRDLRPTATVKVTALVASAALTGIEADTNAALTGTEADAAVDAADGGAKRSTWVTSDDAAPGAKGPNDVLLSSAKVRRKLGGAASWAEIDLEGGSVLPRVVSAGGEEEVDTQARGWLTSFSSHCPEANHASPVR